MKLANVILIMILSTTCWAYLQADLDFDGSVDFYDFATFSDQWLLTGEPNEPNSIGVGDVDYLIAASDSSAQIQAKADYVCDGADDQIEIQAAINALPASGGHIHLSQGRFYIRDTIHLYQYVTLTGTGPGEYYGGTTGDTVIYLANGTNRNAIDYVKKPTGRRSSIRLANFTVDGNKSNQTQGHGIVFASQLFNEALSDILLDRVRVYNCKEDGFHIIGNTTKYKITGVNYAARTFTISGVNAENITNNDGNLTANFLCWKNIIATSSTGEDGQYSTYYVANLSFDTNHTDITVHKEIDSNYIDYLELADNSKKRATEITIRNCTSQGNDGRGFFLDIEVSFINGCVSKSNMDCDFELRDCATTLLTQCYSMTSGGHHGHGIYLNGASGGVSVTNSFLGCASSIGDVSYGIDVFNAHNAVVKGNTIRDYEQNGDRDVGICVQDSRDCIIADNLVVDCDVGMKICRWNDTSVLSDGVIASGNHISRNDIAAQGFLLGNNFLAKMPIAKTADFQIGNGYSGSAYTNTGATGPVTFTLPAASEPVLEYTFVVGQDGQELRIDPHGNETIAMANGTQQGPGKYITAVSPGATCRLKCVTKGRWEHFDSVGTWTVEP
jgi:parallel beta-helix repeat protein